MGWAHPAVAKEEVLRLRVVRGFVDVLVLAGGRASYGAAAIWTADEVNKALRWSPFFEDVSALAIFEDMHNSGQYEDSARELDAEVP